MLYKECYKKYLIFNIKEDIIAYILFYSYYSIYIITIK